MDYLDRPSLRLVGCATIEFLIDLRLMFCLPYDGRTCESVRNIDLQCICLCIFVIGGKFVCVLRGDILMFKYSRSDLNTYFPRQCVYEF